MGIKIGLAIEFMALGAIIATACYDAQDHDEVVRSKTELNSMIDAMENEHVTGVVAVEDGWNYVSVMPQYNSLYMGVHCITDETSSQYQWLQTHNWSYDDEGICVYDGRMLVALTPAFGSIGDYVDLLLADGTVMQTIIVDEKANASLYGHERDGWTNVIEIIVSPEWYDVEHENKVYSDVIAWKEV